MARRFAPLLTAIWDDEDFCALTPMAQRMYMQILSQKRLSLCGVVPYAPRNLARGCTALTVADVNAALDELETGDYVLIDRDTDEILVRTILKHDPPRGSKVLQGMWSAWSEIDSPRFRHHVVHSLSAELWEWKGVNIPESAKALRNTLFPETEPDQEGVFPEPNRHETEPLSPTCPLPPASIQSSSSQHNSHSDPDEPVDDDDFRQAIEHIVDARCENRHMGNERAYRAAVRREAIELDGRWVRSMLATGTNPEAAALTVKLGAELTEPVTNVRWCPPDCPTCDGDAWIDTGSGLAPCPERTAA